MAYFTAKIKTIEENFTDARFGIVISFSRSRPGLPSLLGSITFKPLSMYHSVTWYTCTFVYISAQEHQIKTVLLKFTSLLFYTFALLLKIHFMWKASKGDYMSKIYAGLFIHYRIVGIIYHYRYLSYNITYIALIIIYVCLVTYQHVSTPPSIDLSFDLAS